MNDREAFDGEAAQLAQYLQKLAGLLVLAIKETKEAGNIGTMGLELVGLLKFKNEYNLQANDEL